MLQLFAVSPKVHTTQQKAMGGFVEDNRQVVSFVCILNHMISCDQVLLDTPGIVKYQYGKR